jgi:hypothetical protein
MMTDAGLVIDQALEAAKTPCLTCSFQTEDVVVLHMLRERRPDIQAIGNPRGFQAVIERVTSHVGIRAWIPCECDRASKKFPFCGTVEGGER